MKKYIIALALLLALVATPALAAQANASLIQSLITQLQNLIVQLQMLLPSQKPQTGVVSTTTSQTETDQSSDQTFGESGLYKVPVVGIMINILPKSKVSLPLSLEGSAANIFEGNWGSVQLYDDAGNELSEKNITASCDYGQQCSFGPISLAGQPKTSSGYLLFKKENPSGLPANDKSSRVIISFSGQTSSSADRQNITIDSLKKAKLSFTDADDNNLTDNFSLINGTARLSDARGANPRVYTYVNSAVGDLNGDGQAEGVIGIYKNWGANRMTPAIFVVSNNNGVLKQIAYDVPDKSIWNNETQIKSLYIKGGILTVNLLVLSEADYNLPHYQQQASIPKTVQYKLVNSQLIVQ